MHIPTHYTCAKCGRQIFEDEPHDETLASTRGHPEFRHDACVNRSP